MSNITRFESIYTLQRPVWLDAAGMSKGLEYDRQHLGFILDAGQTLTIRQVTAAFITALTLRLLTADGKTAARFSVGSNWVEARVDEASVPFIDTPYVGGEPVVEFQYPDTAKALPVYRKGEHEAAFYESWESQHAEFGLIDSENINILISKDSIEDLKENGYSIDDLITHYDRIFNYYNALAGLSFEAERDTDLNIKNRYFVVVNEDDSDYEDYSSIEISNQMDTTFWVRPNDNNWDSLHEIAYGYQGYFLRDKYFSASEVWNKIYAACYQDEMLGDRKYKEGWLYVDKGNAANIENKIIHLIANATPLEQWDEHSKLFFIMLMIEKAGKNAFTHFNKEYRKSCNDHDFVAYEHALLDMLSASFAAAGGQVDVTPFIQLVGGYLSQTQQNLNAFSHAKAVYPLYQLVDGQNLEAVKTQLNLDSIVSLVDVAQLKATDLKGNATVHFNVDDFSQIIGEELILMEGERYAYKTLINDQTMMLSDLPIGVYTLRLPTGRDKKYRITPSYLVVKQGHNAVDINFVKRQFSQIVSQEINLLGLSDALVASVLVDHDKSIVVIEVTKTMPHSYFSGLIYARIIVRNKENAVIFIKNILGNQTYQSFDRLAFVSGYKLEIHHEEPSRVRLNPVQPNIIDGKNKINVLVITKSGLKNEALQGDPKEALLERIKIAINHLRSFKPAFYAPFSTFKDDIYLAINVFDSVQREHLLTSFQNCIPADNSRPSNNFGNVFTLSFKGLYDLEVMTGTLDLVNKTFTMVLKSGVPHHMFKPENGSYAFISLTDRYGKTLYSYGLIGNKWQQAKTVVLPISGNGGEVLHLSHLEPNRRLVITNEMQHVRLPGISQVLSYRITRSGLERIPEKVSININPYLP